MTEYNKATSSKFALAGKEVCMAKFVPFIIKVEHRVMNSLVRQQ